MTQKKTHILILLGVAVLVALSIWAIYPPGKKTHLGLDLQGGLEVVYNARQPDGTDPTVEQLQQTIAIINRRVNGMGTTEAQVQQQGLNQISVSLPGEKDPEHALAVIGKTAQLQFFVDYKQRISGAPAATPEDAIKQAQASTIRDLTPEEKKLIGQLSGDPAAEVRTVPANDPRFILVKAAPGILGGNTEDQWFVYEIYQGADQMTGTAIKDARQGFDQNNQPNVQMDFTSQGAKDFQRVTPDVASHGLVDPTGNTFSIVLDGNLESDPSVAAEYAAAGIVGNSAEITGSFTVAEAKDLANVLKNGALPIRLEMAEQQQVSATLGKDSLRQGLIAGMIGFVLVLVYMLFYYRFLGLVADFALIIYAIVLWGLFNFIPITLTLPGIAGMILSIGVAADANVIIFERIKEEVRHGRTVRSAISAGYSRGIRTIIDADMLTFLTAAVLYWQAAAQPRGFALTLMLGVIVSILTAIVVTRAMLGLLGDYAFFNKASFMGVRGSDQQIAAEAAASQTAKASTGSNRPPSARKKKRR